MTLNPSPQPTVHTSLIRSMANYDGKQMESVRLLTRGRIINHGRQYAYALGHG